jgi:uncharacterized membrane protein (UPF0127 family)
VESKVCVFNRNRQSFLGLDVRVADTHLARLRGLIGSKKLRTDGGVWLVPSQGIHTIGMLFPIDVLYLDKEQRVIDLIEHLGPFRISPVRIRCESVLELPSRTIYESQTEVGDELLICSALEMEIHWRAMQARKLEEAGAAQNGPSWKVSSV